LLGVLRTTSHHGVSLTPASDRTFFVHRVRVTKQSWCERKKVRIHLNKVPALELGAAAS
jgi:hypothetical protein